MAQLNEFLHMGGYAFYVWSSFGLSLVVMVWNIVLPRQREKQLIRDLKRRQIREEQQS